MLIKDRVEAGKLLADKLMEFNHDTEVLAIPRGGVIVAEQIAAKLGCKLDLVVSKKITPPGHPEFAIGAITHDGTLFKGEHWDQFSNHPDFVQELSKKKEEVKRRIEEYRGSSEYNLENKTIILVDDGIATGSTVYAILFWLKKQKPRKIILAVPVVPEESFKIMRSHVSRLVVLLTPTEFSAVGQFYQTFEQVSDKKVKEIISKHLL